MKKITISLLLFLPFLNFAQGTCATALPVTVGIYTNNGLTGTELPTPDCSDEEDSPFTADWYSFTATSAGAVTISASNPANIDDVVDTRLHVYAGTCGALTCVGFSDDVDAENDDYTSEVTFTPTVGTTYYFAWDDYWYFFETSFTFEVSQVVLSRDGFDSSKVSLYPNPVTNIVTVSQQDAIDGVSVYNLLGQKVLSQSFNSNEVQVNLESLSAGAYLLEVTSGNNHNTMKVIKK